MLELNYRIKKLYKICDLRLVLYILKTKSKLRLFKGIAKNFDLSLKKRHFELVNLFKDFSKLKSIDENWKNNTNRFLTWISIFEKKYDRNSRIKILEIGSHQGHSALFFLWFFKKALIDCVDIWDNIENKSEQIFDESLNEFSERLEKFKLLSTEFFVNKIKIRCIYDIIFIDGSHDAEDVLSDCLFAFAALKINGLMIIDDVFLKSEKRFQDNSLKAIDAFLNLKGNDIKILKINSQLFIEKKHDARIIQ